MTDDMERHPEFPDTLVTTDFAASVLNDPTYRIVEVDLDPTAYLHGHLPGAVPWDWRTQLRDTETHEIVPSERLAGLLGASGIGPDDKVILYGDNNNWFACWAYWLLSMFGHESVWLMDGGTRKWLAEGREVAIGSTRTEPKKYGAREYALGDRADTEQVFGAIFSQGTHRLVDVRSGAEFRGAVMGPVGPKTACDLAGHIPTAINVPWDLNCREDGSFKSAGELRRLYESFGIVPETTVITYCAIGERASLSWFVLKRLLKYPVVMNYGRSMEQWSRLGNAPVVADEAA